MLKLTLYKNCILNETYQNIFSLGLEIRAGVRKSTLDFYLDELSNKVIILDNVYYENSGKFILDFEFDSSTIYDYNYMKVELYDDNNTLKLKRYCFIQNIEIKNELVYLTYIEDIWSSYGDKINGITESYLERSRIIKNYNDLEFPIFKLPVEYDGNNNLEFENLLTETETGYVIVLQVQYYDTQEYGNATQRFARTIVITGESGMTTITGTMTLIEKIFKNAQGRNYETGGVHPGTLWYYTIDNITLIDKRIFFAKRTGSRILDELDGRFLDNGNIIAYTYAIKGTFDLYSIPTDINAELKTGGIIVKEGTINNNFKIKQLGTLSQKFDIINNGNNINYKIRIMPSLYNFDIYLDVQNQLVKITDSFVIEIPYNFLQGAEIAQQKLQKQTRTINGITKIGTGIVGAGLDIASALGTGGITTFGTSGKTVMQKIKTKTGYEKISEKIPGTTSALDLISENLGGIGKAISGITDLMQLNAPVYTTSYGTFEDSDGVYTAKTGLLLFKINSDNDEYVKQTINNTGYEVYKYINDISKLQLNDTSYFQDLEEPINYNVVKFATVNVYGDFPRSIALLLNEILLNGTKIWYSTDMSDDNLEVL